MNNALIAFIVGAFVLGSGALMAQGTQGTPVPQTSPETTAKLKAEREAHEKAEAKMTPEERAAAKKAKRTKKQKELSQMEKVGNPNAHAKAETVAKSHAATKNDPKPLPDKESRQGALKAQSNNPPGH